MTVKAKTKMVSFRLSPDEYHLCRKACDTHGARNISELARAALQQLIVEPHPSTNADRVRELQERVRVLSADLDRYAAELDIEAAAAHGALESVAQGGVA
ncbi:MAG: hypothetical protein ABL967_11190 [Bryobacteraceae bacterium]